MGNPLAAKQPTINVPCNVERAKKAKTHKFDDPILYTDENSNWHLLHNGGDYFRAGRLPFRFNVSMVTYRMDARRTFFLKMECNGLCRLLQRIMPLCR